MFYTSSSGTPVLHVAADLQLTSHKSLDGDRRATVPPIVKTVSLQSPIQIGMTGELQICSYGLC